MVVQTAKEVNICVRNENSYYVLYLLKTIYYLNSYIGTLENTVNIETFLWVSKVVSL